MRQSEIRVEMNQSFASASIPRDEPKAEPQPQDDPAPESEDRPDDGSDELPENVPDDWLDPKPFDPAGR
jgi:hypothetical protein